jgi:uncharacterized membrane protein YeaQ/YmgE (transglycosylase-associated protein family)
MLHYLWIAIIGFFAGLVAKWLHPGPKEPSGFILTTILGIVGAFVATFLGQAVGWYRPDQGAGFIGAIVGAIIILVIWGLIDRRRATWGLALLICGYLVTSRGWIGGEEIPRRATSLFRTASVCTWVRLVRHCDFLNE